MTSHAQRIAFTKMEALGNDFILIDETDTESRVWSSGWIQQVADRHLGIGFDQMLVIRRQAPEQFSYRIFNADGSDAYQCGNGARCVARWLSEKYGCNQANLYTIKNQCVPVSTVGPGWYSAILGPVHRGYEPGDAQSMVRAKVEGRTYELHLIHIGNSHAIVFVDDIAALDVAHLGNQIAQQLCFQRGINVSFVCQTGERTWAQRIYERGVGETRACGSAGAALGAYLNSDEAITIFMPGGRLLVQKSHDSSMINTQSSASVVFHGEITM